MTTAYNQIDINQEEGNSIVGEIFGNKKILQIFRSNKKNLFRIDLKFATYARTNKGIIRVSLTEKVTSKGILTKDIPCESLEDNAWLSIFFNPIKDSINKEYIIKVEGINCRIGTSPTLYYSYTAEKGNFFINRTKFNGSLSFRTYCAKTSELQVTPNMVKKIRNPRLSVCCVVYNQVSFIRKTLNSILSQETNFDFDILINDDGSTDGTVNILKELQALYPSIVKVVYSPVNLFAEQSFINLLSRAKTEYVALCDGDDYFTDNTKLQKQVDFLDKNKDFSVCFHSVRVINGKQETIFPDRNRHKKVFTQKFTELNDLIKENFIQTNSVVYRWRFIEEDIRKVFPRNILPGDWFLHLLHADKGKIGFIDKAMSVYQKHSQGIWHGGSDTVVKKYGIQMSNFFNELKNYFNKDFEGMLTRNSKSLKERYSKLNRDPIKVSVVVPTYNHEKYIEQCINSILTQKGNLEIEIIVGDDFSTDGTTVILDRLYKKGIINLIKSKKNKGLLNNMRECFNLASGKYIAICEGDDYWTNPWRLNKFVDILEKNTDCSGAFNSIVLLDDKTGKYSEHTKQLKELKHLQKTTSTSLIKWNYAANYSSCVYRGDIAKKVLAIMDIPSDWLFNLYISKKGNLLFLKEKLSVWRVHPNGSWSSRTPQDKELGVRRFLKKYKYLF